MNKWLLKTEPDEFSYDDLEKKTSEPWDGVHNFAALKHMRAMRPGNLALVYHTGKERRIVGICQVLTEPHPDPDESDERFILVDVAPKERLARPVTLAKIKEDDRFSDWELVRLPRLSVMPVPDEHWTRILDMAR